MTQVRIGRKLGNVAIGLTVALLVAVAINLTGQSFGLWGTPTRTVTLICFEDAGKMHCASTPIKVDR